MNLAYYISARVFALRFINADEKKIFVVCFVRNQFWENTCMFRYKQTAKVPIMHQYYTYFMKKLNTS
jgi:hypothetical protein